MTEQEIRNTIATLRNLESKSTPGPWFSQGNFVYYDKAMNPEERTEMRTFEDAGFIAIAKDWLIPIFDYYESKIQ